MRKNCYFEDFGKLTFWFSCWLSSCPTYPRTKRSCPGAWKSRYRVEWSLPWSGLECTEKTAEVAKMVAMRLAFIVSDTKRMTGFQRNVLLLQETSGGRTSTTSSIPALLTTLCACTPRKEKKFPLIWICLDSGYKFFGWPKNHVPDFKTSCTMYMYYAYLVNYQPI